MKRIVCLLLALSLLPVLYIPVGAAEPASGRFTDITDAETQRAAELLYNLEIISGTGGSSYAPNGLFDRAALAAIGVKLSGMLDVSSYGGTVRFPDVRANHWAHKWVMAAVDLKIMSGGADGYFRPSDPMLYGHLVTVLMKLLGYTDADVGLNWPQSYIAKAESLGVSKGMKFSANDSLTRGQAARLIYNFLVCDMKEGGTYIEKKMGATYVDAVVSFETVNGVTVINAGKESYSYTGTLDEALNGQLVSILIDEDENVLSVAADDEVTYRNLTVQTAQSRGLELSDGSYVPIPATANVWEWDGSTRAYSVAFGSFWEDEPVQLAYKDNGTLQYILRNSQDNKNDTQNITILLRMLTRDGQTYVVDENGTEYRIRGTINAALCGRTGRLTIDKDGYAVSFTAGKTYTYTQLTLSEARANGVQPDSGSFVTIPNATPVWGEEVDTYAKVWSELPARETLLLAYNSAGTLQYVARISQRGTGTYALAILDKKPETGTNPIVTAFGKGAEGAELYKNGAKATVGMLEQWDVLQYYESANVVEACSIRITGPYSAARPNPSAPSHITVMGTELALLEEVVGKIPNYLTGRNWTYMLTSDGRIADIRDTNATGKATLGLVTQTGVSLSDSLVFKGTVSGPNASQIGMLSSVQGRTNNGIYAVPVSFQTIKDDVNLANMKIGSSPIAPWCAIYEQVGEVGRAVRLSLSDIPMSKISASKVVYVETNSAGYVTTILLNDVTGDAYTYGYLEKQGKTGLTDTGDTYTYTEMGVSSNGKGDLLTGWLFAGTIQPPQYASIVGISTGNAVTGVPLVTKLITCQKHEGITRYDFDGDTAIKIGTSTIPIADDVQVYVRYTNEYLSISDARAYCGSFEVYTDPWNYKVRFIIGLL